jgi:hypothetical protein
MTPISRFDKLVIRRSLNGLLRHQRVIASNFLILTDCLAASSLCSPWSLLLQFGCETVSFIAAKMQPPLRIAMLECDTPLPNTKAKFQDYGGVFEFLLKCGAKALGRPDPESGLQIKKYQIELNPQNYPDLKDIDAILITGSSK